MEKIKIALCVCLIGWLVCSPAYAESVWMGEHIERVEETPNGESPGGSATLYLPSYDTDGQFEGYSIEFSPVPLEVQEENEPQVYYNSGLINPYYVDWARSLMWHCGLRDYVFFRSAEDTYVLAFGDFSSGFSSEDADVYTLYTGSSDTDYSFISSIGTSFSLSVGDGMVYSNVGFYPSLYDYHFDLIFGVCLVSMSLLGLWFAKIPFLHFSHS